MASTWSCSTATPCRGAASCDAIRKSALPGWFLGGKRLELSQQLSRRVLVERLPIHRWSLARWLREGGDARPLAALTSRDRRRPGRGGLPEFVPHTERYGFLFGAFRDDFELVNGFDMRYEGWGEEDIDLAVRLRRLGLRCGWPGPQGTLLHLWHESRKGRARMSASSRRRALPTAWRRSAAFVSSTRDYFRQTATSVTLAFSSSKLARRSLHAAPSELGRESSVVMTLSAGPWKPPPTAF